MINLFGVLSERPNGGALAWHTISRKMLVINLFV